METGAANEVETRSRQQRKFELANKSRACHVMTILVLDCTRWFIGSFHMTLGWFNSSEPVHSTTRQTRPAVEFHMSSGWFKLIEPPQTPALQRDKGL